MQVPIVCAGQLISPGDVIVADDDGVVAVPHAQAVAVLAAAQQREAHEEEKRALYASGLLSLDVAPSLRERLHAKGFVYESADEAMPLSDVPTAVECAG